MVSEAIARAVLETALQSGGDFSELFVEDTEANTITMINGSVEDAVSSRIRGAGVRVLKGARCAYAYAADTSEEALLAAAKAAAAGLPDQRAGDHKTAVFALREYGVSPKIPFQQIGNDKRIALLLQGYEAAKAVSQEISQVTANYRDVDQRVQVFNSEGVFASDRRPLVRIAVQAVASANGEAQTGASAPGLGAGFEAFERIDPAAAGRDAASTAVTMLHAPECPAGAMPVVIDGGFGGVIFHEACGHSLEATAVSRGNSEFCGKLGQKIASECVTAIDDGTLADEWGSLHIDDEGTETKKNILIENGILKGYLIDLLGGRRMGMPVTGSSRRQNYTYMPTSRMTNTFIAPGKDDEEEMIRTMGDGLYAKKMGGGSVNPVTGEFNFSVEEGYWVKNGQIYSPVRGATLIGKGSQVLLRIDRVGRNMWMAQGMCGSRSGSIPTNVGQPRIRVSELIVGGKGGAL